MELSKDKQLVQLLLSIGKMVCMGTEAAKKQNIKIPVYTNTLPVISTSEVSDDKEGVNVNVK